MFTISFAIWVAVWASCGACGLDEYYEKERADYPRVSGELARCVAENPIVNIKSLRFHVRGDNIGLRQVEAITRVNYLHPGLGLGFTY